MSDFPEWVAFVGLASNQALHIEERFANAMRAVELLEQALSEAQAKAVQVVTGVPDDAPQAWKDLVAGLTLLSKGQVNPVSPLHCEHDELRVMADPFHFTEEEGAKLLELGFLESDDDNYYSHRFGSA